MTNFHHRMYNWAVKVFGKDKANDKKIRVYRFIEEALELGQSLGLTEEEALYQLKYVYGRPVGVPSQEVGGVMTSLSVLCTINSIDPEHCAEIEYNRISSPTVIKIIKDKELKKLSVNTIDLMQDEREKAFINAGIKFANNSIYGIVSNADSSTGKIL